MPRTWASLISDETVEMKGVRYSVRVADGVVTLISPRGTEYSQPAAELDGKQIECVVIPPVTPAVAAREAREAAAAAAIVREMLNASTEFTVTLDRLPEVVAHLTSLLGKTVRIEVVE